MDEADVQAFVSQMNQSVFFRGMEEVARVKDEPLLGVVIAHGLVELIISTLVEVRCKRGAEIVEDHRSFPHSIKVTLLHELGVVSDHHFKLLTWFRKLRNDVAHKPFFKITPNHLQNFALEEHRDVAKFNDLLRVIILDLMNEFSRDIGKVFMPEVGRLGMGIKVHTTGFFDPKMKWLSADQRKYLIPLKSDDEKPKQPQHAKPDGESKQDG